MPRPTLAPAECQSLAVRRYCWIPDGSAKIQQLSHSGRFATDEQKMRITDASSGCDHISIIRYCYVERLVRFWQNKLSGTRRIGCQQPSRPASLLLSNESQPLSIGRQSGTLAFGDSFGNACRRNFDEN